MRISLFFLLGGPGGGLLLSFTFTPHAQAHAQAQAQAQAQDADCPICAGVGNFVEFLGEQVTDALISGASALKGAFFEAAPAPAPAGDNNNIDPFEVFLDVPERQPPPPEPPEPSEPEPEPEPPPQLSPQQNADPVDDAADIELLYLAPSIPPAAQEGNRCDLQRTSGKLVQQNHCAVAIDQIIWPLDCGNVALNAKIFGILTALAPPGPPGGVLIYDEEEICGTFFWTAALTQQQIDYLVEENADLLQIEPNNVGQISTTSRVWRRANKATPKVEIQDLASENLIHFSTPPGETPAKYLYAHFENVGEGITVYYLDISFDLSNPEFSNVLQQVLFAQHVNPDEQFGEGEYDRADGLQADHGGCMLSLIGGATLGVARNAKLINVKVRLTAASMLSGLVQIVRHLNSREQAGERVKGKTVVGSSIQIPKIGRGINERKAGEIIKELIEKYQVVFITSAGNVQRDKKHNEPKNMAINNWPASLASHADIPIVTVGGIDTKTGFLDPGSKAGSLLTISAPWQATCFTLGGEVDCLGTSGAGAMVIGAAADVLSRDYLRHHLALDDENEGGGGGGGKGVGISAGGGGGGASVAEKVKSYLVEKGYSRAVGGPIAAWNGLYPRDRMRIQV